MKPLLDGVRYSAQVINPKDEALLSLMTEQEIKKSEILNHVTVVLENKRKRLDYNKDNELRGIVFEFAGLKTLGDIDKFAKQYGLLGIEVKPKPTRWEDMGDGFSWGYQYSNNENVSDRLRYEPISIWLDQIKLVKNLIDLYNSLSKKNNGEDISIIGNLLFPGDDDNCAYLWADGGHAFYNQSGEELSESELAFEVIKNKINQALKGGIELHLDDRKTSANKVGFNADTLVTTRYLLAYIYYDLSELLNDKYNLTYCPHCDRPFHKRGRKIYCSDSCRVMAFHKPKDQENPAE